MTKMDGTDMSYTHSGPGRDPHVLVLAGGLSYEREVSLRSGRRILDALLSVGVDASVRDMDAALLPALADDKPDAVIVALHGSTGEDGSLQGILDLAGVPYVGADAHSARLAWDKPSAKAVLRATGIATPDWIVLPQERFSELGAKAVLDHIVARFGLPLMVKPAQGGSGLGASVVHDVASLPTAMVSCFAYHPTALVEPYISGTNAAVAVLDLGDGPVALPAVEIVARDGVYDYAARYTAGVTTWHAPARLGAEVADRLARVAVEAHTALGLGDMSRIDVVVDVNGEPQVLGASVAPGMTDTSLLPMAITAAGLDLGKTLAVLVSRAVERHAD
jgi:D-alanine-D-alanine ligase